MARTAGRAALGARAALIGLAWPALAAADSAPTQADFRKLLERVERLEQRNRELESEVSALRATDAKPEKRESAAQPSPAAVATEERLRKLEAAQQQTDAALASDRLSEKEPELVTRLKAVEFMSLEMQKQARQIEALEGITVGVSLTGVVQGVDGAGSDTGADQTRANYRGDVAVTLPGGSLGNADGSIYAQFRVGQGTGVGLRPTYTSTVNTTAFQVDAEPSDAYVLLAQAWYQLDVPLPLDGVKANSRQRLTFNVGKMDPFLFFDQNAAADDETTRFMNNVLVHNPLLDSGGGMGMDAYGFTPGVRVAYADERQSGQSWGLSFGVFGSGAGADFSGSLSHPTVIAQLETSPRLWSLTGNYRLYAWYNGDATDYVDAPTINTGWGASVDQRVNEDWTLFGRFGSQFAGKVKFDVAASLGAETDGSRWGRGADTLGLGVSTMRTSGAYRDATASGGLVGYAASGWETDLEIYYRWRLNEHVEISPDLQWIFRPGGDPNASSAYAIGVRAKVGL